MKIHPLSEIFPLIEGAEFDALVEDIRVNKLREPITTYQKQILDGRNRFRACQIAKVKPRFEEYKGNDPRGFVISLNLCRRHLNESQRGMAAKRLETITHGGDRKSENQDENSHLDRESLGKMFRVSNWTIHKAAIVQDKGIPELVNAVDSGLLAVSRAAVLAQKPAEEQKRFLTETPPKKSKRSGNKLIRVWDASKFEDRVLFLEQRRQEVGSLLRTVNTF